MIDINKKIEKIEKNCIDTAKKELSSLKSENDTFSEEKILEKVNNYKTELAQKYNDEINKLKREFNRNTFDYEMNQKKKVSEFRQSLKNKIENKIILEFKNFVNTPEYDEYLRSNVAIVQMMIENDECTLFITENDYNRYYQKYLEHKNLVEQGYLPSFKVNLDKISNDYIGGCIIVDEKNKVSIDNTIKTNISQKMKEINL